MKTLFYWFPAVLLMGVIFLLSSRTRLQVSEVYAIQFAIFKSLHVIEYAVLYFWTYRAVRNTTGLSDIEQRYYTWLIVILYAISDEIHQVFVPTREGRFRDIIIDTVGATLMALYIWKLLPTAPHILKKWGKKLDII